MPGFRFVHAADLHLDTPFEGVAGPASAVREALIDASLDAWDQLVALTLDEDAAFLLVAGDIYDGARRGMRAQFRFLAGLRRLAEAGVQVFLVHGNHDPLGEGWSGIRQSWPPTVKLFSSDAVESATVVRDGVELATVHGISYAHREVRDDLAALFPRPEGPGLHIALLHCNAGDNPDHGAYSPCGIPELLAAGYHYWALGHVHKRQSLGEGPVAIEYPGDLQGRSPKPSELGAKGALVVDVSGDRVREVRFAPCDRVRFVTTALDIGPLGDLPSARDALLDACGDLQAEHGRRGLLVRVHLEGRGALHDDLQQPDARLALLAELRDASTATNPFVWWESLRDATRPAIDRDAVLRSGDLSAEALRTGEALAADPAALGAFLAEAFAALPARRLPADLRDIDADTATDLLRRAEDVLLDIRERD